MIQPLHCRLSPALVAAAILALIPTATRAVELPDGFWAADQVDPILEQTRRVHLAPDLSHLTLAERQAVAELLEVGRGLHRLYLQSRHHQALDARSALEALDLELGSPAETRKLLDLFRLSKGPIATTLDNRRLPFVPVDPEVPGKNVWPWGIARQEVEDYLGRHPERRASLLGLRSVVRRASEQSLAADLATLDEHPTLAVLHPGLRERLQALASGPSESALYSIPYSVAYAGELVEAYRGLHRAAAAIAGEDPELAGYLRHRARDLLSDDYEAGDASWVTGRFGRLNAQIGSYETYDDELFGVKSFFSLSLLLRDEEQSRRIAEASRGLQDLEDSLPYEAHKRVREDIPVGVYHVIADFGQARGRNTATILPNEASHARKYGRTILLRYNIMTHPELFADRQALWQTAVAPEHAGDFTLQGGFDRTLWHEVGHYLGPARDKQGRTLDVALAQYSDLIEELKSDLVSLFAGAWLQQSGYFGATGLRALYADGVRRTLQRVRPRREQPYQTMQLMQMNYFLEQDLLDFDGESGWLRIHYAKYPTTVAAMLAEVLDLQAAGDPKRAAAFVERYGGWSDDLHGVLAARLLQAPSKRWGLVSYAALEDQP